MVNIAYKNATVSAASIYLVAHLLHPRLCQFLYGLNGRANQQGREHRAFPHAIEAAQEYQGQQDGQGNKDGVGPCFHLVEGLVYFIGL